MYYIFTFYVTVGDRNGSVGHGSLPVTHWPMMMKLLRSSLHLLFLVDVKKLLTHSICPIIIAGGLILIYDFLLSRPRGLSTTTMPCPCYPMRRIKWRNGHGSWVMGHGSRKMTHIHLCPLWGLGLSPMRNQTFCSLLLLEVASRGTVKHYRVSQKK